MFKLKIRKFKNYYRININNELFVKAREKSKILIDKLNKRKADKIMSDAVLSQFKQAEKEEKRIYFK